jgi:mono/diheme cytochrome c family protein
MPRTAASPGCGAVLKRALQLAVALVIVAGAWLVYRASSIAPSPLPGAPPEITAELVAEGRYLFQIASCGSCHTDKPNDGAYLAGGRRFATPFGTFNSPNISPHPIDGIGGWTLPQFAHAVRDGIGPDGGHFYPVFPYTSFTGLRDEDVAALYAYTMQLPPEPGPNRPHELSWPMRFRLVNWLWKLLFFEPGPYRDDPRQSASWNRGAYIVTSIAHCGECHTPRNALGATDKARALAGTAEGPGGEAVPNITQDLHTGIGKWSRSKLAYYLVTGELGEDAYTSAGGAMAEVIEDGLTHLREEDLDAIVDYLLTVPARRSEHAGSEKE